MAIDNPSPATLEKYLKGQHYPARTHDLIATAQHNHAPAEIIQVLQKLSEAEFGGPIDVARAYGKEVHEPPPDHR